MKNYIKTGVLVFLGAFALAGCQKDLQQDESYTGKRISVTAQAGDNIPSRTTLNGFETQWVAGDQIGIFSPQAGSSNDPHTAASGTATSVFTGNMVWGTGSHDFYAYYPHIAGTFAHDAVPVSLPALQTQVAGNNPEHLAALDFMVAAPLSGIAPGGEVSFQFSHLFTLLEFRVVGAGEISKIELTAGEGTKLAFSGGTIDISQVKPSVGTPYSISYSGMAGMAGSTVAVELTSAATLTDNDETTPALYMMINPADLTGQQISVTATINGTPKTITADGFNLARGRKYILVVDPDKGLAELDVLTMIPDPLFLAYCQSQMGEWDTNSDGKLSPAEAAAVTHINCSNAYDHQGEKIASLEGIEYFTGLSSLYCTNNQLTSLDMSKNTVLSYLACSYNHLTSLDVSANIALNLFLCNDNQLTSLNVSNNIALTTFYCYSNNLISLDISKNTALTNFNCKNNPGNGTTFPVKAWFDNLSIPSTSFTTGSWTHGGNTILINYYTGETPP